MKRSQVVVEVDGLSFSYGQRMVLRDVDLDIKRGEFVAILGPNGAGKSTLVRCISGILKCRGVFINGRPVGEYGRMELARVMAYVPQRIEPNFMTVFGNVLLGRRPYMRLSPSKRDLDVVESVIEMLGLGELVLKKTNEISGGELQKVSIARALAQEPDILIMDEPTNNLDLRSQLEVMRIAREFSKEGTSIVVMHDVNMALRFAKRFVFMKGGRVVADGGLDVVEPGIFEEVYGVRVQIEDVRGIPVVVPVG